MTAENSPAGLEQEAVAAALTAFVNGSIMARGRSVQPDDDFEPMGIDSMALLKVLLFVEAEFGFWMPDEDLVMENLRSPQALAHYICRRRGLS
jgi:acyl carrier protein